MKPQRRSTTTKSSNSLSRAITFVGLLALGFTSAVQAQLIANGNFEDGPIPSGGVFYTHQLNPQTLPGWVVFRSSVDVIGPAVTPAYQGQRHLDLHGDNGPGGIRQTIPTKPGAEYLLTFYQSAQAYSDVDSRISTIQVTAAGQIFKFAMSLVNVTAAKPNWLERTVTFTATDTTSTIEFLSLEPNNGLAAWRFRGPIIDTISVQTVSHGTPVAAVIHPAAEVVWLTTSGKTYQVQSTLTLDRPMWVDFGLPVTGDGNAKSLFDSTPDVRMRFFRVLELQ